MLKRTSEVRKTISVGTIRMELNNLNQLACVKVFVGKCG